MVLFIVVLLYAAMNLLLNIPELNLEDLEAIKIVIQI
jgi:hypothetical protein